MLNHTGVLVMDFSTDSLAQERSFGCETLNLSEGGAVPDHIGEIFGVPEVVCARVGRDRWRRYAVAMSREASIGQPDIGLYAARLRARRVLVPDYAGGGKVWLPVPR